MLEQKESWREDFTGDFDRIPKLDSSKIDSRIPQSMKEAQTILAGDIGGTNSRLLLYEIPINNDMIYQKLVPGKRAPGTLLMVKKYMNENYHSFSDIVKEFFLTAGITKPPITACIAVAGPVKQNVVRFSNRDTWSIDGDMLADEFGIKFVRLINDFAANGYGLLTLDDENECEILQTAEKNYDAPIACIGAGTGLGECFLTPGNDGVYNCFPSEGGHAEFAPRSELEIRLLSHLKIKFEQAHRVSVERVVSGTGIWNVYEFLTLDMPEFVDHELHAKILAAGDLKGAVIATNQNNELCRLTMELFATAYGAEAGVAALKWIPYGGLYLTGGLTPKNMDLIRGADSPFMRAFYDKGRVSSLLYSIPIFAVLVEDLGQRGAHILAFRDFQEVFISMLLSHNDQLIQNQLPSNPGITTASNLHLGSSPSMDDDNVWFHSELASSSQVLANVSSHQDLHSISRHRSLSHTPSVFSELPPLVEVPNTSRGGRGRATSHTPSMYSEPTSEKQQLLREHLSKNSVSAHFREFHMENDGYGFDGDHADIARMQAYSNAISAAIGGSIVAMAFLIGMSMNKPK